MEYAPGIPDKSSKSVIPSSQDKIWSYVIQYHMADVAGPHYDFRISDGAVAYSWATRAGLPSLGDKVLWIRQPDHTPEYMSFSGEIADGYGKGSVKVIDSGQIHVISATPEKISFNLYKGAGTQKFTLVYTGGNNWLCMNTTPTKETRPEIPEKKIQARSIDPSKISFTNSNQILTEKIDGAASLFVLRKGRPVEVFSYRKSKRGPELINRTYKYPDLYNTMVPEELDKTTLWGEAYVSDAEGRTLPHREGTGLLNANVWRARDEVAKRHLKFDNVIFNIDKYKGVDYSKKPYGEKIELLKEIQSKLPQLKLPIMAETPLEKRRLYDAIKSGKHPHTTEGWVIWDLNSDRPIKSKLKLDTELYVQGYEEGKGRLEGKLGKILATPDPQGKGPITRVGGGFTDFEREQIWNNRLTYLGKPITIEYQEKLPSGKYRMPIFKVFRTAEFWPT
ncbi:hypothetical protein AYK24_00325 [Thermoplasmatales archaeon SG8-52-4]|nr:MAG: hypothetical protein AYK24_00325 [Thermoplasmatales archaeon SG8-52-4]